MQSYNSNDIINSIIIVFKSNDVPYIYILSNLFLSKNFQLYYGSHAMHALMPH